MPTVKVPALKPLTYQGRSYVRGDVIDAEPADALAMARRREVSLTKGAAPKPRVQTRDMTAEEPAAPARRPRRRYQRRDMTAESPTE